MSKKAIILLGALLCSGCQTVQPVESSSSLSGSSKMHEIVVRKAESHKVPPALALAIVQAESRFNPKAYSKGNYGLGQIRCGTAKSLGKFNSCFALFDPEFNMDYSMKYLSLALERSNGDWCHAATLYNRGIGNKPKKSPYCNKVMKLIRDPK